MKSHNYMFINSAFLTIFIGSLLQTSVHADIATAVGVIIQNETNAPVTVMQVANGQNLMQIPTSTTDDTPLTIPANSAMVVPVLPDQTCKYTLSPVGTRPTYSPLNRSWISGNKLTAAPYLLIDHEKVKNTLDEDGIDN